MSSSMAEKRNNCEWELLEQVHRILSEEGANNVADTESVIHFHHPEDLKVSLFEIQSSKGAASSSNPESDCNYLFAIRLLL